MERSRASVTGLQETAATRGTSDRAICFDWSSAPARGGSKTSPSKAFSSLNVRGRRKRSRRSLVTRFRPAANRKRSEERRVGKECSQAEKGAGRSAKDATEEGSGP